MDVRIFETKAEVGRAAAEQGATLIRQAIEEAGEASIILATGASQFEVVDSLAHAPGIDWGKVTAFHLDEYVGMPDTHPASFRRYLRERFVAQLPTPLRAFHEINGEGDAASECARLKGLIEGVEIAVAFVGIGENGHLAFNDPPADFETEEPYRVVELDEACRRQQMGEGWFPTLEDVPKLAISMSIRQIMKAKSILCSVPEERKAPAVKAVLEGGVTPKVPASILKEHPDAALYLDKASSSLLSNAVG
jgi:glucosamine-6-phosphate deaminase